MNALHKRKLYRLFFLFKLCLIHKQINGELLTMEREGFKYHWWGKGDIDASFGIFFDGFSKILTATGIMTMVFGMPARIVIGKVVPGIGLAIFLGNLWYFYEARQLAIRERRQDVTSQPFGIGASQLSRLAVPDHRAGVLADKGCGAGIPGGAGSCLYRGHGGNCRRVCGAVDY